MQLTHFSQHIHYFVKNRGAVNVDYEGNIGTINLIGNVLMTHTSSIQREVSPSMSKAIQIPGTCIATYKQITLTQVMENTPGMWVVADIKPIVHLQAST